MGVDLNARIADAKVGTSDGGAQITLKESCDIMRDCVRGGTNKLEVARALKAAGVSTDDISSALSLRELYYNGASQKPANGPVNLGNPQASMMKYTQVDDSTSKSKADLSQNGCGAGCLVNASLLHGKEGVIGLLDVMSERGGPSALIKDWKAKAESNTLTQQDLRDMQAVVHEQLINLKKEMKVGNSGTQMVPPAALEAYMKTDTSTFGVSKEFPLMKNMQGARILFVSTNDGISDNKGIKGEHFVLAFNYDNPPLKVADTWPRQDGKQIADPGVYLNATQGWVDPGGSKY